MQHKAMPTTRLRDSWASAAILTTVAITLAACTSTDGSRYAMTKEGIRKVEGAVATQLESPIRAKLERWRRLYSQTGEGKRFSLAGYEDLFAPGSEFEAFDSFAADWTSTHIKGFDEYRRVWERDMNERFPNFTITRLDVHRIEQTEGLAYSTFTLIGRGRLPDGTAFAGSQHGTHVWKRYGNDWRIVQESLFGPAKVQGKAIESE